MANIADFSSESMNISDALAPYRTCCALLAATDIVNRAMFCPECKCEYRPGFTRCSDCDVALVPQLPDAPAADFEKLKNVWTGKDQERCLELCEDFKSSGHPVQRGPESASVSARP